MSKSKVYFSREISPAALVRVYENLGVVLPGKVAIKISTGEAGNTNYLKPELIKELVQRLNGTIVECNTAYAGARNDTAAHLQTAKDHGFTEIANVDIMDADGEVEIPIKRGRHLKVDIIGKNFDTYGSMLNLAHFKGHPMGGSAVHLKINQSVLPLHLGKPISTAQGRLVMLRPFGIMWRRKMTSSNRWLKPLPQLRIIWSSKISQLSI